MGRQTGAAYAAPVLFYEALIRIGSPCNALPARAIRYAFDAIDPISVRI